MANPSISSISQIYGSMTSGYPLTINGTFSNTLSSVTIGGSSSTIVSISPTTIIVTVPTSTIQDNVDVIVNEDASGTILSSDASIFIYGGNYYVNQIYTPGTNGQVMSIKVDYYNNIYYLIKLTSLPSTWPLLVKTGTSKPVSLDYGTLASGTLTILDMTLISNSSTTTLYILFNYNTLIKICKIPVSFYQGISLVTSLNSFLTLDSGKLFVSNLTDDNNLYIVGSSSDKNIIRVLNFNTIKYYKTSTSLIFNSVTFKNDGSSKFLYAIRSSDFYELPVSGLTR